MTVKDIVCSESSNNSMAKRQKTDDSKPISDEMIGVLSLAMDSKADMNIVEFSNDISDIDITPGEPISDSELPPRIKKDKKKKKHSKEKKPKTSKKESMDATHSQDKNDHADSKDSNTLSKS